MSATSTQTHARPTGERDAQASPDSAGPRLPVRRLGRRLTRQIGGRLHGRPDWIAAAAYLLLALWVCAGLFRQPYDQVSAHNPNDHIWFQWLLEHAAYSLRHGQNPLFSLRQNYPMGVNIMANTSVLGISLPLAQVTMFFGAEISYWVFLIGSLAGTGFATYWVLSRHLVTSRVAAWLGGALVGFAPGIIHHANGQPNFVANFVVPFIVLSAIRLGRAGHVVRDGVVLAFLVAYQFFINQEVLLITAVACAVLVLVRAVQEPRRAWSQAPRVLASLAVAGVCAGTLLAYPMWFQFNGPQSYRGLPFNFHSWGEDLAAYVTFSRDTLAGSAAVEKTIGRTEQNTWFGWPLVVVALVSAVLLSRRNRAARTATVVGLLFAIAGVGPQLVVNARARDVSGPWALISGGHVPVLELVQPTRLTLVVIGALGVIVALAVDRLHTVPRNRRRVGYAMIALALVPIIPWPLPTQPATPVPSFISGGYWRSYVPPGYTLLPVPVPNNADGIYTLRWSTRAAQEFAIPHGYFIGPDENGHGWYGPPSRKTTFWVNHVARHGVIDGRTDSLIAPTDEMKAQMKADLVYWHTAVVVLGKHQHEQQLKELWDQVLGPGRRVHDAWIWDVRWLTAPGTGG